MVFAENFLVFVQNLDMTARMVERQDGSEDLVVSYRGSPGGNSFPVNTFLLTPPEIPIECPRQL